MLVVLSVLSTPICAIAQDHHAAVQPDELKWSTPAAYAPGAQLGVIKGDPTKEGLYIVRLKVPAGYKIEARTHPNDENVTDAGLMRDHERPGPEMSVAGGR
ncbi:MAG: hypothetical protein ACXWKQ_10790 [Reyranella sp.]